MGAARWLLVHSPLVGPDTWEPVAEELRRRGDEVRVPALPDAAGGPFWQAHIGAIADAVGPWRDGPAVAVVAHSGAGQLLALIGAELAARHVRVAAYLLVDAGLPPQGVSRLHQLRDAEPAFAAELEALFAAGERFPAWTDQVLAPLVPDVERRRRLLAGLRPQPRPYWDETLPAVSGWPDAPCGVLLLSASYEPTAAAAQAHGWPLRRLDVANHFFMLVHPARVTDELLSLQADASREAES